jgi:diguanylate cyclase (GGDEF)-like protein/PAS domain S-box-containing protein
MGRGPAPRTAVVVAPIALALAGLAVVGLFRPALIDPGFDAGLQLRCIAVVGPVAVVLLLRAALRGAGPRVLPTWLSAATAALLWTASITGAVLGWNSVLVWGYLRAGVLAALAVGLLLSPAVRRTPREWGLLLLDGWLVGASVLVLGWLILSMSGSPLSAPPYGVAPALYWVPFDLLQASVVAGLAMRVERTARAPVLLLALSGLLTVIADITWALTGVPNFAVVVWLILMAAFAGAALVGPLDIWAHFEPPSSRPQMLRLPQLAVIPGLIGGVMSPADPLIVVASVSLVIGLATELVLTGRQNRDIWSTLHRQAGQLDQLLRESRDAIVHIDRQGVIRFANQALTGVLGFEPDVVLGREGAALVHPDDRSRLIVEIGRIGESDGGGRIAGRFLHADLGWRYLEATVSRRTGGEPGYTLSARDVGERVSLEHELRRLAGTDALTGLPNRTAFVAVLEARLSVGSATVLFIDLDGFKAVNDTDGHAVGDQLLRQAGEAIQRELRVDDVAARLGGDEFAVLIHDPLLVEARAVADRLIARLSSMPADPARRTAASVGLATGHRVSADALLGDADLAMYEAKAAGGRRHVVFEPWMRDRVSERTRMTQALHRAGSGQGLDLDLQPIVTMADGRWLGFEALLRWRDGAVRRPAAEFLRLAEETGAIMPIGEWALHTALDWVSTWPNAATGISVNVSRAQLAAPGFADLVSDQLVRTGVAPARLTLEISERSVSSDLRRVAAVLQPLRSLGVRLALDDFGIGQSSLGHLAELPVDELKIDRRFIAGLGLRRSDDVLVRAAIRLAADLGMQVVAEGVETGAQVKALIDHGCLIGQGHRFKSPTPRRLMIPPDARVLPIRAGDQTVAS